MRAPSPLLNPALEFAAAAGWRKAVPQLLTADASPRRYFRLRAGRRSAVLMDASRNLESIEPFIQIAKHLRVLGLSAPAILEQDAQNGFLLLEDFGDDTFARLLEENAPPERLYSLAINLLLALHKNSKAIPHSLRAYDADRMLADIELFLEWRTPHLPDTARLEFCAAWRQVLPLAHRVPASLLLRDFHVANLMLLPRRKGVRRVGLLDFQDAYQGPRTYDLVSLLEDARRDLQPDLRRAMTKRYLARFPALDRREFAVSMKILAAQRHTRVLGIFERLCRRDAKPQYLRLYGTRVQKLLLEALAEPALAPVRRWMQRHAPAH